VNGDAKSAQEAFGGRTILFDRVARGGKVVVLLHGLTASPVQFAEFGRRLHARGPSVLIPRLPRHGYADRLTPALERLTAEELVAFGERTLAAAHELGDRVVLAGFSVGALLCLWLAQREAVERVVAIAPFLGLAWLPQGLSPAAARLTLGMPNRFVWWHALQRERFGAPHGYPRYASHAVAQAYRVAQRLFDEARAAPPAAKSIVIVTNASESTVSNRAAARLALHWRAHGAEIAEHRLRGLPPSHDIIAFERDAHLAERVYPQLLDLVDG
jgi:alpha-beta hydrolase superfamily lysophospholipase